MTRLSGLCVNDEVRAHVKQLRLIHLEAANRDERVPFLLRQLELGTNEGTGRRYTGEDILTAARIYFGGRGCYRVLQGILNLPHPSTLKRHMGGLGTVGTDEDCKILITAQFRELMGSQLLCIILFDEVHILPSHRLRGGHTIGLAEDNPGKLARTVLAFLIKPLMGGQPFVARLVPIYSLQPAFVFQQLCRLITMIHNCNGQVLALMADNHFVSQRCFNLFKRDPERPWHAENPHDHRLPLYLLFDPVHLLKNFRNNWYTQSKQEMSFRLPGSEEVSCGKWTDITQIYEEEKGHVVRQTTLSQSACYPAPLERQKVSLVLDVFHEKTMATLRMRGKDETATVVEQPTKL
jgi:hypothetical protein